MKPSLWRTFGYGLAGAISAISVGWPFTEGLLLGAVIYILESDAYRRGKIDGLTQARDIWNQHRIGAHHGTKTH